MLSIVATMLLLGVVSPSKLVALSEIQHATTG